MTPRGAGRYEKLVVLGYTEQAKNIGGATRVYYKWNVKVGGAIAPPVSAPLISHLNAQVNKD